MAQKMLSAQLTEHEERKGIRPMGIAAGLQRSSRAEHGARETAKNLHSRVRFRSRRRRRLLTPGPARERNPPASPECCGSAPLPPPPGMVWHRAASPIPSRSLARRRWPLLALLGFALEWRLCSTPLLLSENPRFAMIDGWLK